MTIGSDVAYCKNHHNMTIGPDVAYCKNHNNMTIGPADPIVILL
jgi:hypothetical protein